MQQFLLETAAGGESSISSSLIMMVVVFGIFYFILIRPQKKKDKEAQQMRSALEVGDEIMTAGGIIGRVVTVKDDTDTLLIESGSSNTKLRISKSAIHTNLSAGERLKERQQEAARQKELEKERKAQEKLEKRTDKD